MTRPRPKGVRCACMQPHDRHIAGPHHGERCPLFVAEFRASLAMEMAMAEAMPPEKHPHKTRGGRGEVAQAIALAPPPAPERPRG